MSRLGDKWRLYVGPSWAALEPGDASKGATWNLVPEPLLSASPTLLRRSWTKRSRAGSFL